MLFSGEAAEREHGNSELFLQSLCESKIIFKYNI